MGNKKKTADGEAGKVQEMDTGRRVCKTPWMSRGDGKESTVKGPTACNSNHVLKQMQASNLLKSQIYLTEEAYLPVRLGCWEEVEQGWLG